MDRREHATTTWAGRLWRWAVRIAYRPERHYMRGGRTA